jgi:hypothetical protein
MTNPTDSNSKNTEHTFLLPYSDDNPSELELPTSKNRIRFGLWLAMIGYLIFLLGARPSLFGLDRSPVVGFVQISVFLVGLAFIILGSHLTLSSLWPEGEKTIAAEIGSRLISTGYVICLFTGMADIFGLGSHPLPNVFFGPLQARGMTLGMMTIAVGFLLMIRYKRTINGNLSNHTALPEQNQATVHQDADEGETINISFSTLFQ